LIFSEEPSSPKTTLRYRPGGIHFLGMGKTVLV